MFNSNRLNQREQSRRLRKASGCAVGVMVLAVFLLVPAAVLAQQAPGPAPHWEVGAHPAGALHFIKGNDRHDVDFSNYALLGSVTRNFGRYWGVEGEVGGGIGIRHNQRLETLPSGTGQVLVTTLSPDTLSYQANVTVYPLGNAGGVAPYVTGGLGGLTAFFKPSPGVAVDDAVTYVTQSMGGGAKWFSGRWGLRGDYRWMRVGAKDDAPALFGRFDSRYGHRLSTGIVLRF